jgi:hypothetical protein
MKQRVSDNIFDVVDDKVTLTTNALTIPEFKRIWESDRSKGKATALSRLLFIYHTISPKSPYYNLDEEQRKQTVISDFLNNPDIAEEELTVIAAEKYTKLIETPSLRQLKAATDLVDKVTKYFSSLDFTTENSASLADAKKILEIVSELPKSTQSLIDLRKKVEQELLDTDLKIRGDKSFSSVFDD